MKKVTINTEYIKLNQLMKFAGLVSGGGEADAYIRNGEVKVNGEICDMRGKKLRPGDRVEFQSEVVEIGE